MRSILILLLLTTLSYSQQPVIVTTPEGAQRMYDNQRMYNYMISRGVDPRDINPPIGYSHGILRYPKDQLPAAAPAVGLDTQWLTNSSNPPVPQPKMNGSIPLVAISFLVTFILVVIYKHRKKKPMPLLEWPTFVPEEEDQSVYNPEY